MNLQSQNKKPYQSPFYYRNNKTEDYYCVQSDGSQIQVSPKSNYIGNSANIQFFYTSSQIKTFEDYVRSRNHLEEIDAKTFIEKIDFTFNNIISITSSVGIIEDKKRRSEIQEHLNPKNQHKFF